MSKPNKQMKYRILELSTGFYPQERKSFFFQWEYIDLSGECTHNSTYKWYARVSTYEKAIEVVEKRKQVLHKRKFKKIYNI
jgi:hypothetical protein